MLSDLIRNQLSKLSSLQGRGAPKKASWSGPTAGDERGRASSKGPVPRVLQCVGQATAAEVTVPSPKHSRNHPEKWTFDPLICLQWSNALPLGCVYARGRDIRMLFFYFLKQIMGLLTQYYPHESRSCKKIQICGWHGYIHKSPRFLVFLLSRLRK